jgi:hypothetical protein
MTLLGRKALGATEIGQTWSFRGSKSRNKVSVGEPAEGSLQIQRLLPETLSKHSREPGREGEGEGEGEKEGASERAIKLANSVPPPRSIDPSIPLTHGETH